MNAANLRTLSDVLFLITIIGFVVFYPLLRWSLRRELKKAHKTAEDYLDSESHAMSVALRISSEKTRWISSETGRAWADGVIPDISEHTFLTTLVFQEEGIEATIVVRNAEGGVGITYLPGRQEFAQKVSDVLATQFAMKVAVWSKPKGVE